MPLHKNTIRTQGDALAFLYLYICSNTIPSQIEWEKKKENKIEKTQRTYAGRLRT
jgi:hypothetical protein